MDQFPCLGFAALGMCSYDPAHPATTYFSIGNATATLAFAFAIQQFIKPIYRFRLQAYGIRLWHLLALVLAGFGCAVVAAVLPNFPTNNYGPLRYPIVWELFGAFLVGAAYAISALIALVPARIYDFNLLLFIRAGAHLLSAADDGDRVSFAEDLLTGKHNISRLITYASALDLAEGHEAHMEFERLREMGAPLQFQGRPPISAFYRFAHRKELRRASYAASFLGIMSDSHFCSALVRKCPWPTALAIDRLVDKRLHVKEAEPFIQQIGRHAVLNEDSMMAKEIDYGGFGTAPLLSNSLFSHLFMLRKYRPLSKLEFDDAKNPTAGYIARLNRASQMSLQVAIEAQDYWPEGYMDDVKQAYQNLFMRVRSSGEKELPYEVPLELHQGVSKLYEGVLKDLPNLEPGTRRNLFVTKPKEYRHDLVATIASIVYESLALMANGFSGADDRNWFHVIHVFMDLYPTGGDEAAGMNPLQQQLAIKLIEKLRENMSGWYPAVSRILLATIGPYDNARDGAVRTAYMILRDAAYLEFKKLKNLTPRKPGSISDYLPSNVTYDAPNDTLTHGYRDGTSRQTNLSSLNITAVDLLNGVNWNATDRW